MRRSLRLGLIAGLLLTLAGVSTTALGAAESAIDQRPAVLQWQRTHAASIGMVPPLTDAYSSNPEQSYPGVWVAGKISTDGVRDFDGDGGSDVVTEMDNSSHTKTAITARSGATGRVLWSKSIAYFVALTAMRVGSSARAGVVVTSLDFAPGPVDATPVAGQVRLIVRAYDGAGTSLWSYASTAGAYGARGDGAYVTALLPAYDGRAGQLTLQMPGPHNLPYLAGSAVVLDTATGRPHALGAAGDYVGNWVSGGDIDGDGYADPVTMRNNHVDTFGDLGTRVPGLQIGRDIVVGHDATAGALVAVSSRTGKVLWRGVRTFDAAQVLPHVGDRSVDLLLHHCTQYNADYDYCQVWSTTAVNGRTGQPRWTLTTHGLAANGPPFALMGDINGDHLQDFYTDPGNGNGAVRSGATAKAFWSLNQVRGDRCAFGMGDPQPDPRWISDVQPDGIPDFSGSYQPAGMCGATGQERSMVVNGRNGAILVSSPYEPLSPATPLYGAVDGHGSDFLRVLDAQEGVDHDVQVLDGNTLAPVWTSRFQTATPGAVWSESAARLTGDAYADVLLGFRRSGSSSPAMPEWVVLDGATGSLLWSMRFS